MKIETSTLPSRGIPYPFKELDMEFFKVPQIMKLSKSVALKSFKPAVDAMNDVLAENANELTDGDFFYLLTLQRLHYSRPLFTEWHCDELLYYDHDNGAKFYTKAGIRSLVEDYENAEDKSELEDPSNIKVVAGKCTHDNRHNLSVGDLRIRYLNDEPLPEGLDYPRVETLSDSIIEAENPEMQHMLSQVVRWIKTDSSSYLAKKDAFLGMSDLSIVENAMYCATRVVHGVSKNVICKCEKCSAETSHVLDIGPESFFDV